MATVAGPIHVLEMGDRIELREAVEYLAELDAALDVAIATGERFGLVLAYGERKPRHDDGIRDLERQWLRDHRAEFAKRCRGIAFVHPAGRLERVFERLVVTGVAPRFFGVACRRFDDLDLATSWLRTPIELPR
jgi:hypothetical protein